MAAMLRTRVDVDRHEIDVCQSAVRREVGALQPVAQPEMRDGQVMRPIRAARVSMQPQNGSPCLRLHCRQRTNVTLTLVES